MKTVMIWNTIEAPVEFYILDGDYSRFHNIYINDWNASKNFKMS